MKKIIVFVALSVFANLVFAKEPAETLAAFYTALSTGDAAKANELLAPDVAIYESGYVERSRAEYVGHHLFGDIGFAKTAIRKVLQHEQRIDGNFAVIWEETETRSKSSGELILLGTETAVLQKIGDNWHIIHLHWSSRKAK